MDRFLIRKDIYDEIEKAMRDRSHLMKKQITDKNGHRRTVWVRPGENPVEDKGKKQEETTEKKTAKPKYKTGDSVSLEGQKGLFWIRKIDSDGSYHVVDKTGTKGFHVSENHLSGKESVSPKNMEMTNDLQKITDAINDLSEKAHNEKDEKKKNELNKQIRDIQLKGVNSDYFNQKKNDEKNETKTLDNAEVGDTVTHKNGQKMNVTKVLHYGKDTVYETEWTDKNGKKQWNTFRKDELKNEVESKKKSSVEKTNKQLTPTYGRKQIPSAEFKAAEYKEQYDDDTVDTTYDGIEEGIKQALELPIIKRHPEFLLKLRNDLAKAEREPETVTKYRKSGEGAEAVYTPARQKLHNEIIDKLIKDKLEAAKPKDGEDPTFQILGGRGGSGKSTFNKKKSDAGVYNDDNVIVVDPDALKQELANGSGDKWEGWKAKAYHEESSDVSKMLMKKAMALGLNIVMDITMSNADKQIDELKLAKSLGYKTGAYYMHVPKQESFKRAMKRYVESETEPGKEDFTGRLVPPDVLLGMTNNEANFDKVKEFADDWSFYDNFIPFEKDPKTGKNKYKAEKIAKKGE